MGERNSHKRQPRPVYFTREQLDDLCEKIIFDFCMERYGQELNPLPTEALLQLLDKYAHKIDQLAVLPPGVHGVTHYYWDRNPDVQIAAELTRQHWRETRRRSTIAHECSHAIQHAPLWRELGPENLEDGPVAQSCRCEYTDDSHDQWDEWMEWQARYMSGALLMPKSRVCRLAQKFAHDRGLKLPLRAESPPSSDLVEHMIIAFHVSRDAAMVRLKQLGLVG
jgi:Zn-dependent peptidase ImmA (M78 family)